MDKTLSYQHVVFDDGAHRLRCPKCRSLFGVGPDLEPEVLAAHAHRHGCWGNDGAGFQIRMSERHA
jgi:uncharacterized C2H2 Zn-finger protein